MVLRKPDGKRRTLRIPRTVYLRVIGKLTVRRPANLGSFGRISQSDAHFTNIIVALLGMISMVGAVC